MEQPGPIPAPRLAATLHALGLDFLVGILEVEVSRHPENLAALCELGHALTRAGRYEKGLAVDREIVRRRPDDPTSHYNLACSLALLGQKEPSLEALERAVALGYDDAEQLLQDEDLVDLHGEPRFQTVLRSIGAARARSAEPPTT